MTVLPGLALGEDIAAHRTIRRTIAGQAAGISGAQQA